MKKTYFSPVTRFIDLSPELGCLGTTSPQIPINPDGPEVTNENEVLTRRRGIWNWTEDDM